MDKEKLNAYIEDEISRADANVSFLMRDMDTGAVLHTFNADCPVSSASIIKIPIMLTALQMVQRGEIGLDDPVTVESREILDDTEVYEYGGGQYPLSELIYWMIVSSDNTATNALIQRVGIGQVNSLIASLGLKNTVLARKMLDFEALRAGRNNVTSAADMGEIFLTIHQNRILTPELCGYALDVLKRQRDMCKFLRYITDDVKVAHKTGGLDPDIGHDRVSHDAGIFYLENIRYYLGIFVTGAPDDANYGRRLIGRLAKAVYAAYGV